MLLVLLSTALSSISKVILPAGKQGAQILASSLIVISWWSVQAFLLPSYHQPATVLVLSWYFPLLFLSQENWLLHPQSYTGESSFLTSARLVSVNGALYFAIWMCCLMRSKSKSSSLPGYLYPMCKLCSGENSVLGRILFRCRELQESLSYSSNAHHAGALVFCFEEGPLNYCAAEYCK